MNRVASARNADRREPKKPSYRDLVLRSLLSVSPQLRNDYIVPITERVVTAAAARDGEALSCLKQELKELLDDMPGMAKEAVESGQLAEPLVEWNVQTTRNLLTAYFSLLKNLRLTETPAPTAINNTEQLQAIARKWSRQGLRYEGIEADAACLREVVYDHLRATLLGCMDAKTLVDHVIDPLEGLHLRLMASYTATEEPPKMRKLAGMLALANRLYAASLRRSSTSLPKKTQG